MANGLQLVKNESHSPFASSGSSVEDAVPVSSNTSSFFSTYEGRTVDPASLPHFFFNPWTLYLLCSRLRLVTLYQRPLLSSGSPAIEKIVPSFDRHGACSKSTTSGPEAPGHSTPSSRTTVFGRGITTNLESVIFFWFFKFVQLTLVCS